jgi:hypothetical protein
MAFNSHYCLLFKTKNFVFLRENGIIFSEIHSDFID